MIKLKKLITNIKHKQTKIKLGASTLIVTLNAMALNGQQSVSDSGTYGTVATVWGSGGKATQYLQFAMYASIVVGIVALAFMLFNNGNETILKSATRTFAVAGILALAFAVPQWFGLLI